MKKLPLAILAILTLSVCTSAQEGRRIVTVNVTAGEPVKGQFVRADEKTVTVQNGLAETTIKVQDVTSIVFEGAEPAPTPVTVDDSARKAVAALRKLASATEVGVNFSEYGRVLIEAKSEIDGLLLKVEDSTTKSFIVSALAHYVYANEIWNNYVRYPRGDIATKSDTGRYLIRVYEIPVKVSVFTSITRDMALYHIWRKARRDYEFAKARVEK